jgi:sugar lactone lactonase YvrE
MRNSFYRLPLTALVWLWGGVQCLPANAQASSVKRIRMYSRRLDGFTRFPIDSVNIIAYHNWEINVRHPQTFLLSLHQALTPHVAPPNHTFGEGYVRLLYVLTYANGRTERVQMDAAQTVLWHHQLFIADSAALALLLSPLTRTQRLEIAPPPRARSLRVRTPASK